jgi:hypothetical protein
MYLKPHFWCVIRHEKIAANIKYQATAMFSITCLKLHCITLHDISLHPIP